ncbi:carbohydrate esterase family 16 protein [Didymella exigua CBS 183.55]|uniref:Carbohydrate esterase family 16 protein n=1 Tax=Didymella exigua CBS 183.55 TaxID=1150837 RepID=A0A6A5REN5_9PLEO|nr:carbohydrate esterase family 16 protein [Didymella exigua CBS 183.55]KAF1924986.1 carbohydrate esterase family 16 protein [Didymella exigua CBS 183.55]
MKLESLACAALAATALSAPTSTSSSAKAKFSWKKIKSLIAFGDSYTFVQGLKGHPNYTYIGDNFDISFTPAELFENRIVQNLTATASGGPVWTEWITDCGVKPGLIDPRTCNKQLWDFAYAGSNTNTALTPLHWNHTVSLERQIEQFEMYGDPALQRVLKRKEALAAVWIGINDINDLAKLRGKNATFAPLYESVITAQQQLWEHIYALGYKNLLLLNLPPLDRGPSPSVNKTLVSTYNSILAEHASSFAAAHEDANVLQFDVNTVLNGIFDNAASYGFTNTTNFCPGYNQPDILSNPAKYGCGEGLDTYLWYNSGHLTSRVHEVFGKVLVKWLGEQGHT